LSSLTATEGGRQVRSCEKACGFSAVASLAPAKAAACLSGCQKAAAEMAAKASAGRRLSSPALIPASLADTSLTLAWERPLDVLPGESFALQYRTVYGGTAWSSFADLMAVPDRGHLLEVRGLTPYTEYQFRISWRLDVDDQLDGPISEPSLVIRTKSGGSPSSPTILSVSLVS